MSNVKDSINDLERGIIADLRVHMGKVANNMANSMKQSLADNGHIDTGNLYNSIRSETEQDENTITASVIIDAVSQEGTWYAEFLEFGTGIYNENGTGRQTPWRYKDREGNWHTTRGMEADPFIRPSVAKHIGELEDGIQTIMGNLQRYKR